MLDADFIDPDYVLHWRRLKLFAGIVWRIDMTESRMSLETAWTVSTIVWH